jgi:hypothetical protein
MGVGVYSSDFNGTGGTFLVSGIYASEEDYADYRKERLAEYQKENRKENGPSGALELMGLDDEDEDDFSLPDYETWSQDRYDDFNEVLLDSVASIGKELGFTATRRRRFDSESADFDDEFLSLSIGEAVEIGWRSWEHDFVIGIGGYGSIGRMMQDIDGYAGEIVNEMGMAPERAADLYADLVSSVEEYVRIRLMQYSFSCSYKTSGYTSSSYQLPENVEARCEELRATIKELSSKLSGKPSDAIKAASSADRIALAEALRKINDDHGRDGEDMAEILTGIAVYNSEDDTILIADPYEEEGWIGSLAAPRSGIHDYLKTLETNEEHLAPIPRNEATEAWFVGYQEKHERVLLLSADEYMSAVGEDLVVNMIDEDEEEVELVIAKREPAPQAPALG